MSKLSMMLVAAACAFSTGAFAEEPAKVKCFVSQEVKDAKMDEKGNYFIEVADQDACSALKGTTEPAADKVAE